MLRPRGFYPLQIDELTREILRKRLLNLQIRVRRKQPEGSQRVVAAAVDAKRNVVKKVDRITAGTEVRAHVIGQPERAPGVDKRFFRLQSDVGLRDEHGN